MRILFVGDDWVGSNARSMADGFRQAGHEVVVVDTTAVSLPPRFSPPWIYSKIRRRRAPWDRRSIHNRINSLAATLSPDLLFCFRTVHLDQRRLLDTPARLHVHYSPDDASNPYNTTPDYLRHEHLWDLVVTTKGHNMPELAARGATPKFVFSAYDPGWHHLSARRDPHRYLLGFVGNYRPDRRSATVALAERYGERMLVHGPGWKRVSELHRTRAVVRGPVYGEHFSTAIASVTANLVFLNSANRDTHTCRTFEVPAAGGLFVGQRTDEHATLLVEGKECLLFSDEDELHEILRWCERRPERARAVAEAGHRRIVTGNHRYVDRAREIVATLEGEEKSSTPEAVGYGTWEVTS
ncbi:CgeB family protein [Rhodococcus pyridinivorans]|uniref:CgeB family protein n=1 Tax=Rhodococcus pyridinivorans TaxID=103816 RepID=UPI0020790DEF|nr:glycosyltransferase [Rhodococcus pyridinivorans]USI91351.1 glycosyltransferase [Rhodococcus pyridinivorans]